MRAKNGGMPRQAAFPVFSAYDPLHAEEGPLDPLGLDAIAEKLASRLVPGIRERMTRIRFLTAIAVGALVTEAFPKGDDDAETPPHIVWEWLVVEALLRTFDTDPDLSGIPGRRMALRAIRNNSHLSKARYLKHPETTGFHGVYKPLAVHLGLVDDDFRPRAESETLMDAWRQDAPGRTRLLETWTKAVQRCLERDPAQADPRWTSDEWRKLAQAFHPGHVVGRERRILRRILLDESRSQALPAIWEILSTLGPHARTLDDRDLVRRLAEHSPRFAPLCHAILAYETFSRHLQDAFDIVRYEAGRPKGLGFPIPSLHRHPTLAVLTSKIPAAFRAASDALEPFDELALSFRERFETLATFPDEVEFVRNLLRHHQTVQQQKSAEGKRPWFHRLDEDTILLRYDYELDTPPDLSDRFVHPYRATPIANFFRDIA